MTFTIKNVGTAATGTLAFQNVVVPYGVTANTCPAGGLGIGASCTVTIDFNVSAVGYYADTITVFDSASDTATIAVSGNGVTGGIDIVVTPSPGDWNVAPLSSTPITFTATNYGTTTSGPLNGIFLNGNFDADFTLATGTCTSTTTLTELASCSFTVTFEAPGGSGSIVPSLGQVVDIESGTVLYTSVTLEATW
jgi:hypothetical protein